MIAVFSIDDTPRLQYVLDFVFREKGCEILLIQDIEKWNDTEAIKLNYSNELVECDYSIGPSGLLLEDELDASLKIEEENGEFLIRGTEDPLSLIFYLISRYEEYQPHEKDEHGRFTAKQSQQFNLGILDQPYADQLVKELWRKLGIDYSEILENFECVPSFDIDVAWAYKNRPLWRKMAAYLKGKWVERTAVLLRLRKDPYDTYSEIVAISAELDRIICFTPVSDYASYDKNIHWANEHYQSLIRGLNSSGGLGLHPGYQSHLKPDKLKEEKKRLEEIVGHKVTKSRFHFLRFHLPTSYNNLLKSNFKKDYSMGYADDVGFRAGTSFPHYFFDLKSNRKKKLFIFPFIYMDSALKDQLKLNPDEAALKVEQLMQSVKEVGGLFMCIWHNHTINDKGEWENWLSVLHKTVKWGKTT
ncbi:MAG: polysaccharide deacetylase family protein [Crocinitomicaceae bacterium]